MTVKIYVRLIDKLSKEQDNLLSKHRKTESKRLLDKLNRRIDEIGEQINTIYNVADELEKHEVTDPVINKEGKCYDCGESIDLENGRCVIYESYRNGTISLFHEEHFNNPLVAGGHDPIAIIGHSIDSDTKMTVEPLDEEIKTILKVKRGQPIVPRIKPESARNHKEVANMKCDVCDKEIIGELYRPAYIKEWKRIDGIVCSHECAIKFIEKQTTEALN